MATIAYERKLRLCDLTPDMVAYIEKVMGEEHRPVKHRAHDVLNNILHDVMGILENRPCFVPRLEGFEERLHQLEDRLYKTA